MAKLSFVLALAALLSASLPAASARAEVVICSPVRVDCGGVSEPRAIQPAAQVVAEADQPAPLLLTSGSTADINASILTIVLLSGLVHPAAPTVAIPEPNLARRRAIAIAHVLRHNRELLLLQGKRVAPICINCGLLNSFGRRHGP